MKSLKTACLPPNIKNERLVNRKFSTLKFIFSKTNVVYTVLARTLDTFKFFFLNYAYRECSNFQNANCYFSF